MVYNGYHVTVIRVHVVVLWGEKLQVVLPSQTPWKFKSHLVVALWTLVLVQWYCAIHLSSRNRRHL